MREGGVDWMSLLGMIRAAKGGGGGGWYQRECLYICVFDVSFLFLCLDTAYFLFCSACFLSLG